MRIALVRDNKIADVYEGFDAEALEAALGFQGGAYHEDPENKPVGAWWIEPEPEPQPELVYKLVPSDVVVWAGQKIEEAMSEIPAPERLSWETQVTEASEVLNNPEAATNLIAAQAAITGETPVELAAKIKDKASQLAQFTGIIIGIRRKFLIAIAAGHQVEGRDLEEDLANALESKQWL